MVSRVTLLSLMFFAVVAKAQPAVTPESAVRGGASDAPVRGAAPDSPVTPPERMRVIYEGSEGPAREIIRAELALLDAELLLLPLELRGETDAAVLERTGAKAIIRTATGEPPSVSLRRCGGVQRRRPPGEIADAGSAALLLTEVLWAQLQQPCPEVIVLSEAARMPSTGAGALGAPPQSSEMPPRWSVEADVAFAQSFGGMDGHALANLGVRFRPLRWLRLGLDASAPLGTPRTGAVRSQWVHAAATLGTEFALGEAKIQFDVGLGGHGVRFEAPADQRGTVQSQGRWLPGTRTTLALEIPLAGPVAVRILGRLDAPFRNARIWLDQTHLGTFGAQLHLGGGVSAAF